MKLTIILTDEDCAPGSNVGVITDFDPAKLQRRVQIKRASPLEYAASIALKALNDTAPPNGDAVPCNAEGKTLSD